MKSFGDGRSLAIVNTAARGGQPRQMLEELVRIFRATGARVDVALTLGAGDGQRLARIAADEGYEKVIAVGGDGTVHEVVNGMLGTPLVLGVVPIGSGNDFARALGLRDWRLAARIAVLGAPRRVDAALANGRAFVNCAGVGVDAAGVRTVERHKRVVGPLAYATTAVATLATFRPVPVRIEMNGEVIEGKHLLVVVSNSERFAGGMRINPGARVDDGLLDVCVVGDTGRAEAMVLLPRVYRGAHLGHPKVRVVRVREVVIEQPRRMPVEMDGELSAAERLEITCVPGGLTVMAAR